MTRLVSLRALATYVLCMLTGCDTRAGGAQPVETIPKINMSCALVDHDGVNNLPEISVEILGPISALRGHAWPLGYDWARDKANQPVSVTAADEPHLLVIRLPSGRTIRHASKATFFNQKRGIVDRASLMPHLGSPVRYQDAIDVLESILKQWDAEPYEWAKESLAKWKAEGDLDPWPIAQRQGGAAIRGEDKVAISFVIRPSLSNAGWYVAIDVAATLEEERKLWGSSTAPASQPATRPSNDAR